MGAELNSQMETFVYVEWVYGVEMYLRMIACVCTHLYVVAGVDSRLLAPPVCVRALGGSEGRLFSIPVEEILSGQV